MDIVMGLNTKYKSSKKVWEKRVTIKYDTEKDKKGLSKCWTWLAWRWTIVNEKQPMFLSSIHLRETFHKKTKLFLIYCKQTEAELLRYKSKLANQIDELFYLFFNKNCGIFNELVLCKKRHGKWLSFQDSAYPRGTQIQPLRIKWQNSLEVKWGFNGAMWDLTQSVST